MYFRESGAAPARRDEHAGGCADLPGPQLLPSPPPQPKWPWLAAWGVAVVVALVIALRYFVLTPPPDPLDLSVIERNGKLQIEWSHTAKPVASAVRGTLVITDGQTPHTIALTQADLERGNYAYKRTSDDVEVRMRVENSGGTQAESKTTTFLAAVPAQAVDDEKIKALEKERDDLQAEVDRLKGENAGQAERIVQLERNLKVLQARLGIQ